MNYKLSFLCTIVSSTVSGSCQVGISYSGVSELTCSLAVSWQMRLRPTTLLSSLVCNCRDSCQLCMSAYTVFAIHKTRHRKTFKINKYLCRIVKFCFTSIICTPWKSQSTKRSESSTWCSVCLTFPVWNRKPDLELLIALKTFQIKHSVTLTSCVAAMTSYVGRTYFQLDGNKFIRNLQRRCFTFSFV